MGVSYNILKKYYHITTGQFGYPQPENSYEKITYSTDEGCPTCSIGHKQINEFRFRGEPKPKKSQITGLNWVFDQIFVREIVKSTFETKELTGVEFSSPVYNKNGESIPKFYQLRINTILPASLLNTDLGTEVCEYPKDKKMVKFLKKNGSRLVEGPFCGRLKYNWPQRQQILTFKKDAFYRQLDFVRIYEWFGSGASANRLILVSESVKETIENNMFKGAFFKKVELK